MGIYIGFIERRNSGRTTGWRNNYYYNYKPIAEIQDSRLHMLCEDELATLLPESEKLNICFSYNWDDADFSQQMDNMFPDGSLVIFEFSLSELLPHINSYSGERNPTGYKIITEDAINSGKIRLLGSDNVYYFIRKNELISDFQNDAIVEIDHPYVCSGSKVFVELDDFWAGPYEVGYRELTSTFYIKPEIRENKYTVSGYPKSTLSATELIADGYWSSPDYHWTLLIPKLDAEVVRMDMITDEALLESFCHNLPDSTISDGKVKVDDISALLKQYEESVLTGSVLTNDVKHSRLERLHAILTAEADVDSTLRSVTGFICDLLVKYQNSAEVKAWLKTLIDSNPDLLEKLKDSQPISGRIEQLKQELGDLRQEYDAMQHAIEEKKATSDETDRAAIEAKTEELRQKDAEYNALCAKLEDIRKTLDCASSVEALQQKQREFEDSVRYWEAHKNRLQNETSALETQFQQMLSRSHERMVNIAFDGFMSSKMLRSAAEWEAEESARRHEDLVGKVNSVETVTKTPEELVEYLCRTVQMVRPTYSKNTIINIAICMTQSFLTVFSGEPGCGKTSICNLFGEVLGLNQIAKQVEHSDGSGDCVKRYVPVSVERGWTSKRDFIGYYNPLSKTFDKSNRRVYDALHQLDTEKRGGICKLPYIILLDEANLSPMEYYWSDFMNICDDLGPQSTVNLGEDYVFGIPETLHFVATINNDHTTETLSPRLIDRAWIVSLPHQHSAAIGEESVPADAVEIISWESLRQAFIPRKEDCVLSAEVQRSYDDVLARLKEMHFTVSPRIDRSIKRYWAVASRRFEMDETRTDAETVALDYAIAQRILPKIAGNGEGFEKWLEELRSLCSSRALNMSAKILKDIIERGNHQMKYYQFFC